MQCQRFLQSAEDGIAGGEPADVRVVLSGTEIILVNLRIEVLTCEHHIVAQCSIFFKDFAKGFVCIISYHICRRVNNLADGASSVVQIFSFQRALVKYHFCFLWFPEGFFIIHATSFVEFSNSTLVKPII